MLDYQKTNIEKDFFTDFKKSLYISKKIKKINNIVFLCVGTDKITGDCLGPIVGSKLTKYFSENNFSNIEVYGTLESNLSYENINKIIKKINPESIIIVIDAALSGKDNIGKIFVKNDKMIIGKGLNKNKIEIGDISIKAVVEKDYKLARHNFKVLQNISLNKIMNLSQIVSNGICQVVKSS